MNIKTDKWLYTLSMYVLSLLGALVVVFPYTPFSTKMPECTITIIRIGIAVFFLIMVIVLYFLHIQSIPFHADQFYSSGKFINRYQFLKRCSKISFIYFITSSVLLLLSIFDILTISWSKN